MEEILRRAEELGRAIREHPRYKRLMEADARVRGDASAAEALKAYNGAVMKIAEKEQKRQPIEVEEKRAVDRLRGAVVANEAIKAFMQAQADYAELMKKMNDAIYGQLVPPEAPGGSGQESAPEAVDHREDPPLTGPDGCRAAMRASYEKHVRLAQEGEFPTDDSPHACGLYGALGSRYIVGGQPKSETFLWGELAPFLAMTEKTGLRALVEYVVYQEYLPESTDAPWLRQEINSALRSCTNEQWLGLAAAGLMNQVTWSAFLEPDTQKRIERAIADLAEQ